MQLVDVLVILILLAAAVGGFVVWRRELLLRQLRAASPPGAMVRPDDPLEVVQAKNRTWAMLEEAVRILHHLLAQDDLLTMMSPETRRSIEEFLSAYYRRDRGTG